MTLSSQEQLRQAIQQSLYEMATQLGELLDEETAQQLYQSAVELLGSISYSPITLARLSATLLVYQLKETEPGELDWFKSQVKQCPSDEEVEELIESLHRIDTL